MLILTRRIGETIIINNNIKVVPLGVRNNQVRVGVAAPKDIPIFREEIQERITKQVRQQEDIGKHDNTRLP